jgi:hypothetical protein
VKGIQASQKGRKGGKSRGYSCGKEEGEGRALSVKMIDCARPLNFSGEEKSKETEGQHQKEDSKGEMSEGEQR